MQRDDTDRAARLAQRALRELQPADEGFAPAVQLLCAALYRRSRWAEYVEAAQTWLPLLESAEHQALKFDLLRKQTVCAGEAARFDIALRSANEAWALAQQGGDPGQIALALTTQAVALERIGDPWQGVRLLETALQSAAAVRDPFVRFVVHNNLSANYIGTYYLVREQARPAEVRRLCRLAVRHARQAVRLAPRLPQADFVSVIAQGNLGEALVHLGRLDEAEAPLRACIDTAARIGMAGNGWRGRCSWGELWLRRGDAHTALAALQAVWQEMQGAGREHHNTLLRLHHGLYRAHKQTGGLAEALQHLEQYESLSRERTVVQLQAQSRLFVTRAEAEQSQREAQAERERALVLEQQAVRDTLTGLANRRQLEARLRNWLPAAEAAGSVVSLAVLDLDHFKLVNDRHGHALGDAVLVRLARLLEQHTRGHDLVVRLGGEEFVVVFNQTPRSVALEVCERLRVQVAAHDWNALAPGLAVTVSIGVAATPPWDERALFEVADRALYAAKAAGRNQVVGG